MNRRPLLLLAALAVLGVAWLAWRGDSGPTPLLQALRNDPMARYVPPGARLTGTREQDQGSALGKAFLLEYARDFSIAGEDADAALTTALRTAKRAGWRFSYPPSETSGSFGTTNGTTAKRTVLGGNAASLAIVLSTPPGASASTPRLLQVSITATSGQVPAGS